MRWLIRHISSRAGDTLVHRDVEIEGPYITVGRGAGQDIHLDDLSVALEHARFTSSRGRAIRIEALGHAPVRVDGRLVTTARLRVGARIDVGLFRMRVQAPPPSFAACIDVRRTDPTSTVEQRAVRRQRRATLEDTWLARLPLSAWLTAGVLLLALAWPLSSHFVPKLRAGPVDPMQLWLTGPSSRAHSAFGDDCQACHQQPFSQVSANACVGCHTDTPEHAAMVTPPTDCTHCHREHNGQRGLVSPDARQCTQCHGKPEIMEGSAHPPIADFSAHPEFRVELAAWRPDGSFAPQMARLDGDPISENSNLRFPHDVHLAATGVNAPEGRRFLDCVNCHRLEPGGGRMRPVSFEHMCQDCHRLSFDPNYPEREVPHADALGVQAMLQEFYTNLALRGGMSDPSAPAAARQRRRPGARPTQAERMQILEWADRRAARVTRSVFEGTACGVCHRVEQIAAEQARYAVQPVRLAGSWFPSAEFSHRAHGTMSCDDCHGARSSAQSEDVLIPHLGLCQQCHQGQPAKGGVESGCGDCHRYHQEPREELVRE